MMSTYSVFLQFFFFLFILVCEELRGFSPFLLLFQLFFGYYPAAFFVL